MAGLLAEGNQGHAGHGHLQQPRTTGRVANMTLQDAIEMMGTTVTISAESDGALASAVTKGRVAKHRQLPHKRAITPAAGAHGNISLRPITAMLELARGTALSDDPGVAAFARRWSTWEPTNEALGLSRTAPRRTRQDKAQLDVSAEEFFAMATNVEYATLAEFSGQQGGRAMGTKLTYRPTRGGNLILPYGSLITRFEQSRFTSTGLCKQPKPLKARTVSRSTRPPIRPVPASPPRTTTTVPATGHPISRPRRDL